MQREPHRIACQYCTNVSCVYYNDIAQRHLKFSFSAPMQLESIFSPSWAHTQVVIEVRVANDRPMTSINSFLNSAAKRNCLGQDEE